MNIQSGVSHTEAENLIFSYLFQIIYENNLVGFPQRGLIRPRCGEVVVLIRDMTCTRSCSYSFMYS